jgi:hypothetical protein
MSTRTITAAATAAIGLLGFSSHASACYDLRAAFAGTQANESVRATSFNQFVSGFASGRTASAPNMPDVAATAGKRIVGFWKFAFTAPDGVTGIDWGFQSWHDDGTEITNSAAQLPTTGNFCTGAWAQERGAYVLTHWALGWNLPATDPSDLFGLINIKETVNVDRTGTIMTGTVSLDLYQTDGTTFVMHLADGTVSGVRITP